MSGRYYPLPWMEDKVLVGFFLAALEIQNWVPLFGFGNADKNTWPRSSYVTKLEVLQYFDATIIDSSAKIHPHKLTPEQKFMFNCVPCSITSRKEIRGSCLLSHFLIMYHLFKQLPQNLPSLIFHHIRIVADTGQVSKEPHPLPYGMWLSYIQEMGLLTDRSFRVELKE